jgi:hypothetical protein
MIVHMKATPEYVEGREAWTRFDRAMHKAITVSPAELKRRIEAENQSRPPRKRGRPRKATPSA